ncbi:VOC family protein [Mucilaginibacter sp. RS28]|uniref:VOC family protein n=1 Tax=Mucilaginibacter straminoryzae TaxID=2932774 RepID=A0A9X1WZ22_9SPHI|nr:VOC family protein [Mucilaginibacter straminoryzae]MCJ8208282.1 VOC family protein [Mucilaginibacter straminoryzae]
MFINPYLNFAGNTEEAFNFYKSILGGEFAMLQRFSDNPDADKLPEDTRNMIMHIALPIGNNVLMGTDAPESMGFKLNMGNNSFLCLCPDSREDADSIFNALSEGGQQTMPMQDMFWGAYYGVLTDQFGVQWMINYQPQQ